MIAPVETAVVLLVPKAQHVLDAVQTRLGIERLSMRRTSRRSRA